MGARAPANNLDCGRGRGANCCLPALRPQQHLQHWRCSCSALLPANRWPFRCPDRWLLRYNLFLPGGTAGPACGPGSSLLANCPSLLHRHRDRRVLCPPTHPAAHQGACPPTDPISLQPCLASGLQPDGDAEDVTAPVSSPAAGSCRGGGAGQRRSHGGSGSGGSAAACSGSRPSQPVAVATRVHRRSSDAEEAEAEQGRRSAGRGGS